MQEVSNVLFSIKGFDISLTDLASIATAISVIIGIFQLRSGEKVRRDTAERDAVKEAVEIAKVFQSDILDDIAFTFAVYERIGLQSFVKKSLPSDQSLRFTIEEAKEIFGVDCKKLYQEYERKVDSKVIDSAAFTNPKYQIKTHLIQTDDKNNSDNGNDKAIDDRNKIMRFIRARGDALNKLEWVAMLINSHAANGTVIYQSLHQTICSFVRANYLFIAEGNTDDNVCDKYYSNLIELYNNWNCASCEMQKKNDKRLKKLAKRTEKLRKQNEKERARSLTKGPKM